MNRYRLIGLGLLLCVAPLLAVVLAEGTATALGCTVNEGGVYPCPVFGVDIGGLLYMGFASGWLLVATLPLAGLLLVVLVGVGAHDLWTSRRR